jgi:hypothetical protein
MLHLEPVEVGALEPGKSKPIREQLTPLNFPRSPNNRSFRQKTLYVPGFSVPGFSYGKK